jgi:GAF domain-containing protein
MASSKHDTQIILREIAEAAIHATSLVELYQTVHHLVGRVLPADLFHINLVDEAAGEIVVPYTSDRITLIPERRPLDKGLTEYVMHQGRTMHITPAEMDRLSASGEYTLAKVQNVQTRHYLGAPLLNTKGKPFGVVSLITLGDTEPFKPEDVEFLSIAAAQISMAIESKSAVAALHRLNAELEQCVEARTQELYAANQELTAMNEQMAAINQTLEGTNKQLEAEI